MIFDTTLRDGEQSPGCSMTQPEKLRVARALADLGVDVIEAGFPGRLARRLGERATRSRARSQGPIICGLARCNRDDIDRAWAALQRRAASAHPRLPRHQRHPPRVQAEHGAGGDHPHRGRGREASRAILCEDVEFSPEDASRTELEFLHEVVEAVDRGRRDDGQHPGHRRLHGAGGIRRAVPLPAQERARHRQGRACRVHCHDDLGMAVANSLAAVRRRRAADRVHDQRHRRARRQLLARRGRDGAQDARGVLRPRRPASTRRGCIRPAACSRTSPACRSRATRRSSARTRSRTSRASTSTACSSTARPTRSCGPRTSACRAPTWCSASTAAATRLRERVKELGFELDDAELDARVRRLQGAGRQEEGALRRRHRGARAEGGDEAGDGPWQLARLHVESDSAAAGSAPGRAAARRRPASVEVTATGDGPVDAAFKAVENATGVVVKLRKFEVRSVSVGEDAQGEAVVTSSTAAALPRHQRHHRHRRVGRASFPRGRQPDRGIAPLRRPCRERAADRAHRGGRGLTTGHA